MSKFNLFRGIAICLLFAVIFVNNAMSQGTATAAPEEAKEEEKTSVQERKSSLFHSIFHSFFFPLLPFISLPPNPCARALEAFRKYLSLESKVCARKSLSINISSFCSRFFVLGCLLALFRRASGRAREQNKSPSSPPPPTTTHPILSKANVCFPVNALSPEGFLRMSSVKRSSRCPFVFWALGPSKKKFVCVCFSLWLSLSLSFQTT